MRQNPLHSAGRRNLSPLRAVVRLQSRTSFVHSSVRSTLVVTFLSFFFHSAQRLHLKSFCACKGRKQASLLWNARGGRRQSYVDALFGSYKRVCPTVPHPLAWLETKFVCVQSVALLTFSKKRGKETEKRNKHTRTEGGKQEQKSQFYINSVPSHQLDHSRRRSRLESSLKRPFYWLKSFRRPTNERIIQHLALSIHLLCSHL